jgi:hypothetical protein
LGSSWNLKYRGGGGGGGGEEGGGGGEEEGGGGGEEEGEEEEDEELHVHINFFCSFLVCSRASVSQSK